MNIEQTLRAGDECPRCTVRVEAPGHSCHVTRTNYPVAPRAGVDEIEIVSDATRPFSAAKRVIKFRTTEARDLWLDMFHEDRRAIDDAPGAYRLPDGSTLGVCGLTVSHYPAPPAREIVADDDAFAGDRDTQAALLAAEAEGGSVTLTEQQAIDTLIALETYVAGMTPDERRQAERTRALVAFLDGKVGAGS